MPTYEYRCTQCDEDFEIFQSFTEDSLKTLAGDDHTHQLRKVFSPVGIAFKGSGFYKNDSSAASKAKAKTPKTDSSDSGSGKSDSSSGSSETPSNKSESGKSSSSSGSKSDSKSSSSEPKKSSSTSSS